MHPGRHAHSVLMYCHEGGGNVDLGGFHAFAPKTIVLVPAWMSHYCQVDPGTHVSCVSYHDDDLPPALWEPLERIRQGASPVVPFSPELWRDDAERILSALPRPEPAPPAWVHRAVRFVFENCLQPLRLAEISARVGVSAAHLTAQVKRWTGKSLGQWLVHARLDHAGLLLRHGQQRVSDVAEDSGFADLSHFRRLFRRQHGLSPAEYRVIHV